MIHGISIYVSRDRFRRATLIPFGSRAGAGILCLEYTPAVARVVGNVGTSVSLCPVGPSILSAVGVNHMQGRIDKERNAGD